MFKKNQEMWFFVVLLTVTIGLAFTTEPAFALEFESKMKSLTGQLIGTVLPLLSILGLVYAAILAFAGDAGAKAKILTIIGASIIGFLAPAIIQWLQRATGS